MLIPIENIYYLLSYAWDKLTIAPVAELVSGDPAAPATNLLAGMLLPELQSLLAQGLATDYVIKTKSIRGIKGKLLLSATFRQSQIHPGEAVCSVEERSPDILPNQVIKATLAQLVQTPELTVVYKNRIKSLLAAFAEVQLRPVTDLPAVMVPRHQLNRYRFVLDCCLFIRQNLMPVANGQEYELKSYLEDKKQMAVLFEAFVRNFYRREQKQFQVKSEKINWQGQGATKEAQNLLPAMFTDISLQSPSRKIIIDTKFYKKALLPHYQKERLISRNLYQLLAYLQNSQPVQPKQSVEGILLYPVVNKELNLEYTLSGNKVRICTINLNQPWALIKNDLLELLS